MNDLIKDENGLIKTGEGTAVNPQFMSQQGLQQAQSFAGVPISSESLSNTPSINLPTPTPQSTSGVAIAVKNLSSAEQAKATLDAEEQAYKDQAKIAAESSKSKVKELFGLQQNAYDEKLAGYQTDEFKALKELKTKALNDQISLRKAQDAEIKAINENSMLTDVQRNQKTSELNNRYAFQSAQLSLTSQIASNNFNDAKSSIDDLYTLTMEKYAPQINYYSQLAQNDQKIFNDAEIKILENKRDEYKTLQTQEADFEKTKGTMMIKAKENGADNATIQAMSRATDMNSLVQSAGSFAGDVLDRQYKQAQIAKTYADIAKSKADAQQALNTLPSATQTRVQGVAGQFDAEQAVKNYQTSAEAIDAMRNSAKTPTDDIGRIYAFAKVMDPNSVVREGEYATVQEYSTALLERTGLKAKRVFENSGFLTDEARKFMLTTLDNRLASSKKAYDNIYNSYGDRINKVTGRTDGKDYITDYSAAFKNTNNAPSPEDDALLKQFGL